MKGRAWPCRGVLKNSIRHELFCKKLSIFLLVTQPSPGRLIVSFRISRSTPKTPGGRQILWRVDVKRHAHVGSLDFDQFAFAERADQPARALVAREAHRRLEEPSAEKNGIAAPTFA
jgi:hypothetical protein